MDFDWPDDDDPRRVAVRDWLDDHDGNPSQEALAHAGYVAPHWPKPYGLEADPITQLLIDEELAAAGVKRLAGGGQLILASARDLLDFYVMLP